METHPGRDERDAATADISAINEGTFFAMYSVFSLRDNLPTGEAAELADDALVAMEKWGVTIRGFYDVAGFRADSDLLIWTLAEDPRPLQAAYKAFRASRVGECLEPFWSAVGTHRPAEFNRSHVPAAFAGFAPRQWLTVYPFVRSYDWYYLPSDHRSAMLREHGQVGRQHPEVVASTLSAFSLGDYEWLLAFEADEVHSLVESMRDTRNTEARLHVREETPFFTGPRMTLDEWIESYR